ncbi:MAG: glycerol-3-phosphate 1-O-acyltransferase PlsY [Prevotellaceae bacterium]|jgi:glycerol-3-phosphate acyltransferase PlsY|nr:glycerol-3-phosphate 1-O-acyltransferase PlsY [Prevotellaceae bacterium]
MINFASINLWIRMNNVMYFIWLAAAYLLGSISSAVWVARTKHGINIREHGSGNAGATNILRVLGPKAALPVFIFDFLKGLAAVQFIRFTALDYQFNPELYTGYEITLGICAVLGHIFPIFASFRGGKGVATVAGVLVAISPYPMLLALIVFLITFLKTHYVSLSSIIAAITFPVFVIFLFGIALTPEKISLTLKCFSLIASTMIIITHRKNIKRLRNGTENKISFKKKIK